MKRIKVLLTGMCYNSKFIYLIGLLFICLTVCGQAREEFNGPMPSWVNVKERFNVKGDGKKDDSEALQLALDSLTCSPVKFNTGNKTGYTVLYFPKGKYRITKSLVLRGKVGVNIIGEDPAKTIIEWGGATNDTMFWSNGSAYFKIARITWDGKKKDSIEAIGIHWKDKWKTDASRSFASLNIEISDCIFNGLAIGIGGGFKWNDSEIKINRCVFNACSQAAISIRGANALDYWIWYCKFLECNIGVNCLKGNYHLYSSYFKGSKVADILNDNGYYSSVRGCFSDGSAAFSIDKGSSSNPFKRIFQDNIIKKNRDLPIVYHHIGKPTFFGNKFDKNTSDPAIEKASGKDVKTPASPTSAVMTYTSWAPSNFSVLSVENEYYYKDPFFVNKSPRKDYVYGDQYGKINNSDEADFLRKLPSTPSFVKRIIFSLPPGASAEQIQKIIDKAAKLKGQRPVVHFPFGEYQLDRTIVIPPNCDMQLTGDGLLYATVLKILDPSKFKGGSLFKVEGPSYIEIRDMHIGWPGRAIKTAISFSKADQQGARVTIDQLNCRTINSLLIDQYNYTRFEKNNSFFSDGNIIIGGAVQKTGKGTLSVNCFGGSYNRVQVKNNAQFLSKDCWWEGDTYSPVNLSGDGQITIDGTKMAPKQADSMPIIVINKFTGKFCLMNAYVQGGVKIEPDNRELELLFWNLNFYYKKDIPSMFPGDFKGKMAYAGLTSQCFFPNDPYCKQTKSYTDSFVKVKDANKYFAEMTKQSRESRPALYSNLPAGRTNILVSRVTIESFEKGLEFN
jgi:hypothetical protein